MNEAIEFFKWCNTPMFWEDLNLRPYFRVIPQFPMYEVYIIIDEHGKKITPAGVYLTIEEVYEYWKQNK